VVGPASRGTSPAAQAYDDGPGHARRSSRSTPTRRVRLERNGLRMSDRRLVVNPAKAPGAHVDALARPCRLPRSPRDQHGPPHSRRRPAPPERHRRAPWREHGPTTPLPALDTGIPGLEGGETVPVEELLQVDVGLRAQSRVEEKSSMKWRPTITKGVVDGDSAKYRTR